MERIAKFKLCVFGDGGVGKTTLITRYVTKVFDEDLKMTIGTDLSVKDVVVDDKKVTLRIWDFAGEERFKILMPSFAKKASGGVFVFDTTRFSSLKNIKDWLSFFEGQKIPIIMVGSKTDLVEKRSVENDEAVAMSEEYKMDGYIECSSKSGDNIEQIFEIIARKMMKKAGLL